MAQIFIVSQTSTSVTVYLGELDTGYSFNDRHIEWYVGYTLKAQTTVGAYVSKSNTATLTGLHAGVTYTIYAKVFKGEESEPFKTFSKSVTIETDTSTRPSKFGWTTPKESGKPFNLTATEWNTLTENINAVRVYRTMIEYSFTTAVIDNNFTASMYNQAVKAIKGISGYGTSLNEVSTGDTITAKKLNDLVTEINSVP